MLHQPSDCHRECRISTTPALVHMEDSRVPTVWWTTDGSSKSQTMVLEGLSPHDTTKSNSSIIKVLFRKTYSIQCLLAPF